MGLFTYHFISNHIPWFSYLVGVPEFHRNVIMVVFFLVIFNFLLIFLLSLSKINRFYILYLSSKLLDFHFLVMPLIHNLIRKCLISPLLRHDTKGLGERDAVQVLLCL